MLTRRLTFVLALAILAAPAAAKLPLSAELSSLETNLELRIDAIGPTPATKQEKKEQTKLVKAGETLEGYAATNDIPDLKILGKAGKLILKSKTADEDIWRDVRDVVYCLIDLAKEKKGLGEDVLAKLYDAKYKAVVQKLLDKGQAHLDAAADMVMDDPVKAHKIVIKAWKGFLKAVIKGEKLDGKQGDAVPDHLFIQRNMFTFSIYNSSNKDHFVRDVILTGEWRTDPDAPPTEEITGASVAALWPDHFKVQVFGSGSTTGWDCACMINRTEPGNPVQDVDLHQYFYEYKARALPGTGDLYFKGLMVVVVSNKHTPGMKGEKIYRIPLEFTSKYY